MSVQSIQKSLLKLTQLDAHKIRVIHFWNPDCNRFNQQHLEQIRQQYERLGIGFYLALVRTETQYKAEIEAQYRNIRVLELGEVAGLIPSTPSAAIIKAGHGLTYFGPYSEGAMCSAQSGSFVEKHLRCNTRG